MNLQDIQERISEYFKGHWESFQETNLYIGVQEKYLELNPLAQKAVLTFCSVLILYILMAIPLGFVSTASDSMDEFNGNKEVLRDLLKIQRDKNQSPNVSHGPAAPVLKTQVAELLSKAGLSQDQIQENSEAIIQPDPNSSLIPASLMQRGVQLTLIKLNLKQIVDIAHGLQSLSQNTKVSAMDVKANASNDHYFDVMFRLVGFTTQNHEDEISVGAPKHKGGKEK